MFYVKSQIGENAEIRIQLDYCNVFTVCPLCNKEHTVDITEIFDGEEVDLDSVVYCVECSQTQPPTA